MHRVVSILHRRCRALEGACIRRCSRGLEDDLEIHLGSVLTIEGPSNGLCRRLDRLTRISARHRSASMFAAHYTTSDISGRGLYTKRQYSHALWLLQPLSPTPEQSVNPIPLEHNSFQSRILRINSLLLHAPPYKMILDRKLRLLLGTLDLIQLMSQFDYVILWHRQDEPAEEDARGLTPSREILTAGSSSPFALRDTVLPCMVMSNSIAMRCCADEPCCWSPQLCPR